MTTEPRFKTSPEDLRAAFDAAAEEGNKTARYNAECAKLAYAYGQMCMRGIEARMGQITERIEGHKATAEDAMMHGNRIVQPDGTVAFLWRGVPVLEFVPATYGKDGWQDASLHELEKE